MRANSQKQSSFVDNDPHFSQVMDDVNSCKTRFNYVSVATAPRGNFLDIIAIAHCPKPLFLFSNIYIVCVEG